MNNNNKNWEELNVSEGEEISSLTELSKKEFFVSFKKEDEKIFNNDSTNKNDLQSRRFVFNDMEEIKSPEIVDIYKQVQKNKIESIEFVNTNESFFPKLFDTLSQKSQKVIENQNGTLSIIPEESVQESKKEEENKKSKKIKPIIKKYKVTEFKSEKSDTINKDSKNLDFLIKSKKEDENNDKNNNEENLEENLNLNEENISELEELKEVKDEIETVEDNNYLVSLITENEVKYPGKFDPFKIDRSLLDKNIKREEELLSEEVITGEMFSVKRAEVFYQIDKQIYAKREGKNFDISRIKKLKYGIFLPLLVGIISFSLLILIQPLLYIYFEKTSKASLEENVIKDSSILEKIAKQKEEEVRRNQARLEEERRRLEYERSRMENIINEELLKKHAEIENQFKKKYAELESKNLSEKEYNAIRKELEKEKEIALKNVEEEKNKKLEEQKKILEEKNIKIKEAEEKLKKAIENKEYEVANITKSFQEQIQIKEKEREEISRRLKELNEINQRVKEFNEIVYQLISGAMEEFKNNKLEAGLIKLNTVLKYYKGRLDFVLSNPDLKNKMQTDIFFVQTISKLVQDVTSSSLYSKEFVSIVNKFKRVTEYYKNAENYYAQKNWQKANDEYSKVLEEFDEINFSYNRLKEIEKQIQNLRAAENYNRAIDSMKNNRYQIALTQFTNIIRETPLSDYTLLAVNSVIELTNKLLPENIIAEANKEAKIIFDMANKSYESKKYDDALALYDSIITRYPMSEYVKKAYSNIISINNMKNKGDIGLFENKLRENFRKDYEKFVELYKKGNFRSARDYYFTALNNAFSNYTNDSIVNFKKEEDKYISTLTSTKSEEELESLLSKTKKDVEDKFNKLIEEQKINYEKEIAKIKDENIRIKKEFEDFKIASLDKEELNKIKENYDLEIAKKDKEITNLTNKYNESITYIETLKKEIEDSKRNLITEKEKIIKEKEKEIDAIKKGETEAKNYIEKIKKDLEDEKSRLLTEKDNLIKLKTEELENLKKEYQSITENYNKLKKELQSDKTKLIDERDKLLVENKNLIDEKNKLVANNKNLNNEIEKLKEERDKIIKDYSQLNKSEIAKEKEKFLKDKERLESENKSLLTQIENLKAEKNKIVEEYTNKLKDTTSNKELVDLKKRYDMIIADKDKEIDTLKSQLNSMGITDDNKLREEIIKKDIELKNERENNTKLKEQLVESYKKYTELEKMNILQNEKNQQNYKKELTNLQKRYKELEDSYNKYKEDSLVKYQEIEEKIKKETRDKIEIEKQRLTNQFMEEINRLNEIINAEEKFKREKGTIEKEAHNVITLETKYFARIIEISGNYVTFQFFTTDFINEVKKGDEISVVRVSNINNIKSDIFIAKIEITNINNTSLFGRGITISSTYNAIKIGDLLKK